MVTMRSLARRIRHLPGVERWDWLWDRLRGPYQRLLGAGGRGFAIAIVPGVKVRLPADYAGVDWEDYEPPCIQRTWDWSKAHSGGLLIDVGCAMGIFTLVTLFADPSVEAVAIDSDLASLAATKRVCSLAAGRRLRLVHGFVLDKGSSRPLEEAVRSTDATLARTNVSGDLGSTQYVCFDYPHDAAIPENTIDDLFAATDLARRPILLKCDVEGAEWLVLRGAAAFIAKYRPTLLLSIHPTLLPRFGHTSEMVSSHLAEAGYDVDVFSIDYEEHWWCSPKA